MLSTPEWAEMLHTISAATAAAATVTWDPSQSITAVSMATWPDYKFEGQYRKAWKRYKSVLDF